MDNDDNQVRNSMLKPFDELPPLDEYCRAVLTLLNAPGTDPVKLKKALFKGKAGRKKKPAPPVGNAKRGPKRKSRAFIDNLLAIVEEHKKIHPGATDLAGIRDFLDGYAVWKNQAKGRVRGQYESRYQKALSRRRTELRKQSQ